MATDTSSQLSTDNLSNPQKLIEAVKSFIIKLESSNYKGSCGRIAVIGGCKEYTGAPYFAAISSLRVGADLAHVFCTSEAAPVIKSYHPDLIVHPVLNLSTADVIQWLPRMHSVVIGPGLGRDPQVLSNVKTILSHVTELQLPLTIDGDGLFLISEHPEIISGYKKAILTPNAAEFNRLHRAVTGQNLDIEDTSKSMEIVKEVSQKLGGVTIIRKGREDIISDGHNIVICSAECSLRRCGGQGDLLAGSLGTFSFWAHKNLCSASNDTFKLYGPSVCAAYAACLLTRACNKETYRKLRRAMLTSDMISVLPTAFEELFCAND